MKGQLDNALEYYNKSLAIQENQAPGSLVVATSYCNIGSIYYGKGLLDNALEYYHKSLLIKESKAPESLDVATSYNNIGSIYSNKGLLDKALEYYNKSLSIQENKVPESLDIARTYNGIGLIYSNKGLLDKAMEYYNKSLSIQENEAPESLDVAASYNSIGVIYYSKGLSDKALEYYNKSLLIQENEAPDSLHVASCYYNIALVFRSQSQFEDSFCLFLKSFSIRKRDLIPYLISTASNIFTAALSVERYDSVLEYADLVISADSTNKLAFNAKGLALHRLNRVDEALQSFDRALSLDAGYADATIHRLEVLIEKFQYSSDSSVFDLLQRAINAAKEIKPTDYDENYKRALIAKAEALGEKDVKIDLPFSQYLL